MPETSSTSATRRETFQNIQNIPIHSGIHPKHSPTFPESLWTFQMRPEPFWTFRPQARTLKIFRNCSGGSCNMNLDVLETILYVSEKKSCWQNPEHFRISQNIQKVYKRRNEMRWTSLNVLENILMNVSKWSPSGLQMVSRIAVWYASILSKNPKRVYVDKCGQPSPLVQKGLLID